MFLFKVLAFIFGKFSKLVYYLKTDLNSMNNSTLACVRIINEIFHFSWKCLDQTLPRSWSLSIVNVHNRPIHSIVLRPAHPTAKRLIYRTEVMERLKSWIWFEAFHSGLAKTIRFTCNTMCNRSLLRRSDVVLKRTGSEDSFLTSW